MKVFIIVGTRPQIIKSAPIIKRVKEYPEIDLAVVHTGQHYDDLMSDIFFKEFSIPKLINLRVGSGSHAYQIGNILIKLSKILENESPNIVLIPGDTNSALASALAASKLNIFIAHIEAGARSYDMTMPEEVNRRLIDHCSQLLFTVSPNCTSNLMKEGLGGILSGDTMYEALSLIKPITAEIKSNFVLITLHRPSNVDNEEKLTKIVNALCKIGDETRVIFPLHPRTKERLLKFDLYDKLTKKIEIQSPLSYLAMLDLIKSAKIVITDSGGLQKEAFWFRKQTITIRNTTEWRETIELGFNRLSEPQSIYNNFQSIKDYHNDIVSSKVNPYITNEPSSKIILETLISKAPYH